MMLDRMEGNAELKSSVQLMLAARRLTHSVLLVGEEGLGAGFAARCIAADYLYPAGGAPAEALLRGECCRAVGKPGDRDSGHVETGIVREAISVAGMGAGGKYLVSQVKAMRSEIFNTSLSAEGRAVLLYHVERMNEGAKAFLGTHDFAAFCAAGAQVSTTVRTIFDCHVEKQGESVRILVTGDGFLYNMVRILAGTLMAVGMGQRKPEEMPDILAACDRAAAGPTAPAKGLMLVGMEYQD